MLIILQNCLVTDRSIMAEGVILEFPVRRTLTTVVCGGAPKWKRMLLSNVTRCIGLRAVNFNEKPSGAAPDIIPLESSGAHARKRITRKNSLENLQRRVTRLCAPRGAGLPRAGNVKGFQCFRTSATMTTAETPRLARCCSSASFAPSLPPPRGEYMVGSGRMNASGRIHRPRARRVALREYSMNYNERGIIRNLLHGITQILRRRHWR